MMADDRCPTCGHKLRELKPHGTMAAYLRHYRQGERPCDACREANTAHSRDMRERKRRERVA